TRLHARGSLCREGSFRHREQPDRDACGCDRQSYSRRWKAGRSRAATVRRILPFFANFMRIAEVYAADGTEAALLMRGTCSLIVRLELPRGISWSAGLENGR